MHDHSCVCIQARYGAEAETHDRADCGSSRFLEGPDQGSWGSTRRVVQRRGRRSLARPMAEGGPSAGPAAIPSRGEAAFVDRKRVAMSSRPNHRNGRAYETALGEYCDRRGGRVCRPGYDQQSRDFSGTWTYDAAHSSKTSRGVHVGPDRSMTPIDIDRPPSPVLGTDFTAKQDAKSLTLELTLTQQTANLSNSTACGGINNTVAGASATHPSYALDGSESHNKAPSATVGSPRLKVFRRQRGMAVRWSSPSPGAV